MGGREGGLVDSLMPGKPPFAAASTKEVRSHHSVSPYAFLRRRASAVTRNGEAERLQPEIGTLFRRTGQHAPNLRPNRLQVISSPNREGRARRFRRPSLNAKTQAIPIKNLAGASPTI